MGGFLFRSDTWPGDGRHLDMVGVVGSNPIVPTRYFPTAREHGGRIREGSPFLLLYSQWLVTMLAKS